MTLSPTVIIALLVGALLLGLGTTTYIQYQQNKILKIENAQRTNERDIAIEAHDALTKEVAWANKVFRNASILNARKEEENARLYSRIKQIMSDQAKAWAAIPVPPELLVELPIIKSMPTAQPASSTNVPTTNPSTSDGQQPDR